MAKEAAKVASSSENANTDVQTQVEPGPGQLALKALLANGRPDPKKVVKLIDAHRGEREALFALLHQTLGNGYVQEVMKAMHGLRIDTKRKEVAAGDPSNPDAGSFVASKDGAQWRTSDGDFSGKAGKDGLDATYRIDDDDAIEADVDVKKKEGTIAWERDGENQGELYADWKSKDRTELGLRRAWEVGDGATLTGGVRHQDVKSAGAKDSVASQQAFATYQNGATTIDGGIGISGGELAGSANVATTLGEHDKLNAAFRHDAGGTSLAADHAHTFGDGAKLTTDGHVRHHDDVTTGKLTTTYKDDDTTLSGGVTRAADKTTYHASGMQKLDKWTLNGNADFTDRDEGNDFFSGKLSAAYKDSNTSFDASLARSEDATTLHAGARQQLTPALSLGGSLDHAFKDGAEDQSTGKLDLKYRDPRFAADFGLEGGLGARDYLSMNGSATGRLAPNFYASTFGGATYESGKQTTGSIGAGLTFTPNDKAALTLAGVLDHDGHLETRLQFDIFKSRVENAAGLSQAHKNAVVSLFVAYAPNGPAAGGMMNSQYGSPATSQSFGPSGIAGIRFKF